MNHPALNVLSALMSAPALFDDGVEATRNACVAGAPLSAAAITAAAYYGNPLTGTPALTLCMERLALSAVTCDAWLRTFAVAPHPTTHDPLFSPGFGFVPDRQRGALRAACAQLLDVARGPRLELFWREREQLEAALGPLNHAGLCALVCVDQDIPPDTAERAYLLMRVEPALLHAQKAKRAGLRKFPFFEKAYTYEGVWPEPRGVVDDAASFSRLAKEVGLDV